MRRRLPYLLIALVWLGAVLTALFPSWIETVFGVDPDRGSGSVELAVYAAAAICVALVVLLAARRRAHR